MTDRMRILTGLVFLLSLSLAAPEAFARGGGYFGLGLGGAMVSGEDHVKLKKYFVVPCNKASISDAEKELCSDSVHTSETGGIAILLRLGYNFFGYAAIEASIMGYGNGDSGGGTWEGAGHVAGVARVFPFQFVKKFKNRWWDPNLYFGAGHAWSGYHLEHHPEHEGRGWTGMAWHFGLGADFMIAKGVSAGLDLRFIKPKFSTYYYNWEDNLTDSPESTPSTLIFAPMATLTFHFADPDPGNTK